MCGSTMRRPSRPPLFGRWGKVPLKPFTGTIGVAPAEPGTHSIIPPRRVGGNMDVRDLSQGTELFLPVEVAGALFSVGDTHAAQGRRRGLRHRHREPHAGCPAIRPDRAAPALVPALQDAGTGDTAPWTRRAMTCAPALARISCRPHGRRCAP
jgi:hypothetical protein